MEETMSNAEQEFTRWSKNNSRASEREAFMAGWNAREEWVEPRRHSTRVANQGASELLEAGVPAWLVWTKRPGRSEVTAHISYLVTDSDAARASKVVLIPEDIYPEVKAYAGGDALKAIDYLSKKFPYETIPDPVR
jgi:hypothetical protein